MRSSPAFYGRVAKRAPICRFDDPFTPPSPPRGRGLFLVVGAVLIASLPVAPLAAAEIAVLAAGNLRPILDALAPEYERAHGDKPIVTYGPILQAQDRIARGDKFDLVILPRAQIETLAGQGKVSGATDVAHSAFVLLVRAAAEIPDFATADAFKRAVLAAPSVAYTDPEQGGLSGIVFTQALDRLGILAPVKVKAVPSATGGAIGALVAKGGAALGAVQIGDVDFATAGVDLVGKLPPDVDPGIVLSAGIVAIAARPEAAKDFLAFLKSPAAVAVIRAKGMEP